MNFADFIISVKIRRQTLTVSAVSKRGSLSSCKSLLYASGKPFIKVSRDTRLPKTLPDLPRMSSAASGFFFCGMMLLPVVNASESSRNPNSLEFHITISSQNRLRCIMTNAEALQNSAAKSRSATASILLWEISGNRKSFAVIFRSIGKFVPANAAEPSGITLIRL